MAHRVALIAPVTLIAPSDAIHWIDLWVPLVLLGVIGLAAIAFARL